jgi:hypothetical protein
MIDRLLQENDDFKVSFEKIEKFVNENDVKQAITTIEDMSESIIRHAVEEEARIMRVIIQKAKEESSESIRIMQEHNWVIDFLKHKLQNIENEVQQHQPELEQQQPPSPQNMEQEIKRQIREFITNLRNHFSEEEQIVFPLALKSDSS